MNKKYQPLFRDPQVKEIFETIPTKLRKKLLILRKLIFDTAEEIKEVGELGESLKWNEPSYAPAKSRIGSPIRINIIRNSNKYAIYFNCQSNLIPTFRQLYPKTFKFEGTRSIIFDLEDSIPLTELRHCISMALTYHLIKNTLNPT